MPKFRTGVILAAAVMAVAVAGAVATLNAQKKSVGVTAEPRVVIREGPADQASTFILGGGPQIGVQIRDVADDETSKLKLPAAGGVVVESVTSGSPAEKAGVKAGDVLAEFDGERVRSVAQLTRLVRESAEGRAVKVAVWREGKRLDLSVTPAGGGGPVWFGSGEAGRLTGRLQGQIEDEIKPLLERELPRIERRFRLEELPEGRSFRMLPRLDREGVFSLLAPGQGRLGIGVEDLTGQLASYFGTKDGILVRSVDDGSPAAKAGVKAGDVITSINGDAVKDVDALLARLGKMEDGAEVTIGLVRDHKPLTLKATIAPRATPRRVPGRGGSPII